MDNMWWLPMLFSGGDGGAMLPLWLAVVLIVGLVVLCAIGIVWVMR